MLLIATPDWSKVVEGVAVSAVMGVLMWLIKRLVTVIKRIEKFYENLASKDYVQETVAGQHQLTIQAVENILRDHLMTYHHSGRK